MSARRASRVPSIRSPVIAIRSTPSLFDRSTTARAHEAGNSRLMWRSVSCRMVYPSKSVDTDFDVLQRRNPHRLVDTDSGRDGGHRSQSIADAVGCAHDATMDRKSDQKSDIERQLQQRQQDDRAERPVEEDDHRAWKLRREYRARRELAPSVKLQCDQRERRHQDLDRERQLQRPDEAGQDQQIGQAEYELGNRFAPDLIGAAFVHEARHHLDSN
jgi:hypothetical protein